MDALSSGRIVYAVVRRPPRGRAGKEPDSYLVDFQFSKRDGKLPQGMTDYHFNTKPGITKDGDLFDDHYVEITKSEYGKLKAVTNRAMLNNGSDMFVFKADVRRISDRGVLPDFSTIEDVKDVVLNIDHLPGRALGLLEQNDAAAANARQAAFPVGDAAKAIMDGHAGRAQERGPGKSCFDWPNPLPANADEMRSQREKPMYFKYFNPEETGLSYRGQTGYMRLESAFPVAGEMLFRFKVLSVDAAAQARLHGGADGVYPKVGAVVESDMDENGRFSDRYDDDIMISRVTASSDLSMAKALDASHEDVKRAFDSYLSGNTSAWTDPPAPSLDADDYGRVNEWQGKHGKPAVPYSAEWKARRFMGLAAEAGGDGPSFAMYDNYETESAALRFEQGSLLGYCLMDSVDGEARFKQKGYAVVEPSPKGDAMYNIRLLSAGDKRSAVWNKVFGNLKHGEAVHETPDGSLSLVTARLNDMDEWKAARAMKLAYDSAVKRRTSPRTKHRTPPDTSGIEGQAPVDGVGYDK